MFTGLVEALGKVDELLPEPNNSLRLRIAVPSDWQGTLGESVAINGCCLTVVDLAGPVWSFQAGSETLSKTNLGDLRTGSPVNLERALPSGARLGGHFVQGHVDATGTVEQVLKEGEWTTLWFKVPGILLPQMVSKGSIAVDGVSLTIVQIEGDRFSVALIPHTLAVTTLGRRNPSDRVNLETDILGKYVQRLLETGTPIAR